MSALPWWGSVWEQEARDLALREVVLRSEMAALRKDCARMLALLLDTQVPR